MDELAGAPSNFEAALQELEGLVQRMESGELSLEQSLEVFERGVRLTRVCQTALRNAEHRVSVMMQTEVDRDGAVAGGSA